MVKQSQSLCQKLPFLSALTAETLYFMRAAKRPSASNFKDLIKGHGVGLLFLGVFGYIVKVMFIPVNNIIASSE